MSFQVLPLSAEPFAPLFGLSDEALASLGVQVMTADTKPGFPCRVSLRDAEPGERVLLLNYAHQPADTPYRSSHAIFVIEDAEPAEPAPDTVPDVMAQRLLSLRAFDTRHMMTAADVVDGREAASLIETLLADPRTAYIHAHYARRGCFAARIERG